MWVGIRNLFILNGFIGMGTHWTCATPRFHKSELPELFSDNETAWAGLYEKAENFLKPIKIKDPKNPFDDNDPDKKQNPFSESIRHYVVLKALQYELPDHQAQQLPLAASKDSPTDTDTLDYINWHSPYTIIEPINSSDPATLPTFTIYTNSLCTKLEYENRPNNSYTIKSATVQNVRHEAPDITINAKCYIIAAGAVLGPQVSVLSIELLPLSLICSILSPASCQLQAQPVCEWPSTGPIPDPKRRAFPLLVYLTVIIIQWCLYLDLGQVDHRTDIVVLSNCV